MRLRDYQMQAIDGNGRWPGILSALETHRSALVVMATGLGKTVIFAHVAASWKQGDVLCLVHRIELVNQIADTLAAIIGYRPPIEQGDRGLWVGSELYGQDQLIVVGSLQSMITRRRREKYAGRRIGLIIIDEAHHAIAPAYVSLIRQLREQNPELRVLGVTATPKRTDNAAMTALFDVVAFEMSIIDGIRQGYLVDLRQKIVTVEDLDLSQLPTVVNQYGERDFRVSDLEAILAEEGRLHAMTRPLLEMTPDRHDQAIVFAASLRHAHVWASVINHYRRGSAAVIDHTLDAGSPEREDIVRRYMVGDLQYLVNYAVCTEGFDAPSTRVVAIGRPTKSRLLKTQMIGRATRPLAGVIDGIETAADRKAAIAASGKPHATILDYTGRVERLDELVTCADILGGDDVSEDVMRRALDIIGSQPNGGSVLDALDEAKRLIDEEVSARRRQAREVIEKIEVRYTIEDISNARAEVTPQPVLRGGATDRQIEFLLKFGIDYKTAAAYSKRQASAVLDRLIATRPTVPQARLLTRLGHSPTGLNFKQASELISRLIGGRKK